MVPPADPTTPPTIGRREAIRRAALLAGVALSPEWLTLAEQARPAAQTSYLTAVQRPIMSAIADRIIPRTDTPGAADVGVPAFIDLLYGEFMSPAEQQLLADGLARVEAAATSTHGASFPTLDAERQDLLLRGIAKADEGREQSFFGLFRSATILGYFTSEQVGRNVLNYDPVPGRYDGCIPIDQTGRRNWTT
jgi:hypothetical protein